MSSEFDLIRDYFTRPAAHAVLGVGDDAALLAVAPGMELAVSTDMLVAGRHFFEDADPRLLGRKCLAVNLSDLAAMGAVPRWATLALALPNADETWLAAFAGGFFEMAERFGVDLVGGDTTRGPLNISVTIMGEVPAGKALRRSGALAGDDIWVSGRLGNAALALAHLQGRLHLSEREAAQVLPALHDPKPRVALGQALLGLAHGAIDLSDGLLADLGHIVQASKLGAEIDFLNLPASDTLVRQLGDDVALECLLAGGDDYELCFSADRDNRDAIIELGQELDIALTRIGQIGYGHGVRVSDESGKEIKLGRAGFDHFA
ncbi:MAG: thiamine-phosphate kinase [Sulfuricella sp.]|nr:thiamine-phosphate kinase [Sulfuricella sp.]